MASLLLLAFALRCLYIKEISGAPFFDLRLGDAEAYHEWALRIAGGDWLGQGVFYQAPLYPYFLAVLYRVVGDGVVAVRLVQAFIGAISCAMLGAAGVSLFGRRGAIAGLLLAVYPSAIYFDGSLDKTSLMAFLMTAFVALVVAAERSPRRWFAAGVVLGLLTLTRENALLLAVPLLTMLVASAFRRKAVNGGRLPPEGGSHASAWGLIAGCLIVLLPIGVRNLASGGEFQLTTAQLGPNLYIGNHRGASGTYEPLVVGHGSAADERDDATRLAQEARGRPLSPREVSRYWTARALDDVRADPIGAATVFVRKLAMTFNAAEISDTETQAVYAEYSWLLRILRIFDFGVLLGLAIFGAVAMAPGSSRLWVLLAMIATYAVSVAAFYVLARYRFPLVPMLMLFAAGGIVEVLTWRPAIARQRVVVGVAAALSVTVMSHATIADERGARAAHFAGIATALAADPARFGDARQFYARALAEAPGHPATEFGFATLLTRMGRGGEAIPHYRATLGAWPHHAGAHFNLGVALRADGQFREAADQFSEAVRLRPDDADAHLALARTFVDLDRVEDAIGHYEQALAIRSNDAGAHNDLGTTLANAGRIVEAIPHFERAVALDPSNEQAKRNLTQAKGMINR